MFISEGCLTLDHSLISLYTTMIINTIFFLWIYYLAYSCRTMIRCMATEHSGLSLFAGVGERTREGNDLYYEMQDSSIIEISFSIPKEQRSLNSIFHRWYVYLVK